MHTLLRNPKYWLDRAGELRTIAEQLQDPNAKDTMLRIAMDCDRLAEHAVRHSASDIS
jgi:hypothetical protein